MALYPSLEDLKVDQLMKAQFGYDPFSNLSLGNNSHEVIIPSAPIISELDDSFSAKYPSLNQYMGLEFSQEVIALNMPEYLEVPKNMDVAVRQELNTVTKTNSFIAPVSGHSEALQKSQVTNRIRQVILCKDYDKKLGLRIQSVNNGIFVNLVIKDSSAAMAGLRFGDQILEINGKSVAGMSTDAVHDIIKQSMDTSVSFIIRDRPFERTVTLHKDSTGHFGFTFKDGKIVGLVVGSSAARNGLLTNHHLLEVNGQNVVGLKDKEITKIISDRGNVITITIIPSYIYQHMTKSMSSNLLKTLMDHSIPTF